MKTALLFLLCCLYSIVISSQAPSIQWQNCYGTVNYDKGTTILTTSDNGYIVTGGWLHDACGSGNGSYNGAVLKLNPNGNLEWHTCLELPGWDESLDILEENENGYIVLSATDWNAFDFVSDPDVMKININGEIEWNSILNDFNIFGYSNWNDLYNESPKGSILKTIDGGYVIGGNGHPYFFQLTSSSNSIITKLNSTGGLDWQTSLGGNGNEVTSSIQHTSDGNYIFAGSTNSNDGDVIGNHGLNDFWVVKINSSGTILWQKCFGGNQDDFANYIQVTPDGGYIVAGNTNSLDGNAIGNHGGIDALILKLDSFGNIVWQKTFGGSNNDYVKSIQVTPDGGYIFAGSTNSNNGDVSGNQGNYDAWIVKLGSQGNLKWQACYGGSNFDEATSIQNTLDGGYIFAGSTESNNGDVIGNHGFSDIWIAKIEPSSLNTQNITSSDFYVYPNPVKDYLYFSEKVKNVVIYNVSGQRLLEETNTEKINLDFFPTGLYFISVRGDTIFENIKIIKK